MHPFLRRAHPIGGMAEPASSAHDAGSQFARGHMLAQALLAAQTTSIYRAQHLLRRAHPNDGMVEPAVAAREAENLFFSQQMLAQARATDKHSYPIDKNVKSASFAHKAGSHFVRKHLFALCRKSQGRFLNMGLCPIPHIKRRFRMESTSPAPSFYCWNSACHARLIERQSPSRPHTPLHPIDGNVEPASSAREAESHFASRQMLA